MKYPVYAGLLILAAYATAAYVAAPLIWAEIERQERRSPRPMLTQTPSGIPGDPINVGLVGDRELVLRAFAAIGWRPADRITLETSIEIGLSVVLDRPYPDAPVSTLVYDGRPQDLALEKEDGASASRRRHVRLWSTDDGTGGQAPLWLGAVSLDRDAGFSHDTGQVTHHIAPDVDAARDELIAAMRNAGLLASSYPIPGRGATDTGRNGGGDPYVTDGLATVGVLKP